MLIHRAVLAEARLRTRMLRELEDGHLRQDGAQVAERRPRPGSVLAGRRQHGVRVERRLDLGSVKGERRLHGPVALWAAGRHRTRMLVKAEAGRLRLDSSRARLG